MNWARGHKLSVGYAILAVAVTLGLYLSWSASNDAQSAAEIATAERSARSVQLNAYLAKQCRRDADKDKVFVGILARTIKSVRARSDLDPAVRNAYIHRTSDDIKRIKAVDRRCVADIPPPIPDHAGG